ncbi:SDR family oxidoreductase [soil metagenome]
MDLHLNDKLVLITGGSKGLGLAAARVLLGEGARVAIVSRSADNIATAIATLAAEGLAAKGYVANLSDAANAEQVVAQVEAELGPIDVLVNSAGDARRKPAGELDAAAWKAAMDAKFYPYVHTQEAVLKRMHARAVTAGFDGKSTPTRDVGTVVNIVGTGGRIPTETHIAGSTANAALLLSTLGLAKYYARFGIRINAVNPGVTLTDRVEYTLKAEAQRLGVTRDEAQARAEASAPMLRLGRADEIADVVAFVASARSSYMVGALVQVDGGQKIAL